MSICVTSDNHVVIAFTGASHSRVVRNANDTSSSSWSNDTAFPAAGGKQLSSSTGTYMWSVVVPLSSGSFYTVWVSASGTKALGRSCASDGTLGSVETCTDTNVTDYFGYSVNSWNGEVWIGWTSLATYYYIRVRKRNSSGTWESFAKELQVRRSRLDRAISALEAGTKSHVLIEARTETNEKSSLYADALVRARATDAVGSGEATSGH